MVDFDNDGDLDAFVCHDVEPNVYYINNGTLNDDGTPNMTFVQGGLGDTVNGGNYGSIWVDYDNDHDMDLFIAKCRGGSSSANINQLHKNNGNGVFEEIGSSVNLADNVQTCPPLGEIMTMMAIWMPLLVRAPHLMVVISLCTIKKVQQTVNLWTSLQEAVSIHLVL